MRIIQTASYQEMSQTAAILILNQLVEKRELVLGLATGQTPSGLYQALIKAQQNLQLSLAETHFFHLDEYLNMTPEAPESMAAFLQRALLDPLNIPPAQRHFVPAASRSPEQACLDYEAEIEAHGGIDVQILGIGQNGHIAFNEPGTAFDQRTHIAQLSASTRNANARYFASGETPEQAMTLGLQSILQARQIILLASGQSKAAAIHKLLEGPIHEDCPATVLRFHPHLTVVLDREAASDCRFPLPRFEAEALQVLETHTPMGQQYQRILVAAPHPDDASIGCGGLLARLQREGAELHFVSMSSGHRAQIDGTSKEERIAIRQREAEAEAALFGGSFSPLNLPFYEHNYIPSSEDIRATLNCLQNFKPDLVLSTSPEDLHPAHRFSARIIQEALRTYALKTPCPELWFYEGPWFLFDREAFNTVVALSAADQDLKMRGIQAHASQISRKRYDLAAASLARFRAITVPESRLSRFGGSRQDLGEAIEIFQRVRWQN